MSNNCHPFYRIFFILVGDLCFSEVYIFRFTKKYKCRFNRVQKKSNQGINQRKKYQCIPSFAIEKLWEKNSNFGILPKNRFMNNLLISNNFSTLVLLDIRNEENTTEDVFDEIF